MSKTTKEKTMSKTTKKKPMSNDELIRNVLHKYFEGYDEYEPWFSAQDAIDEIAAIVDL